MRKEPGVEAKGKRIPSLQVIAQGRLVDKAIIQLVKDFEKPSYKISDCCRSMRVRYGRDIHLSQPVVKTRLFCLHSASLRLVLRPHPLLADNFEPFLVFADSTVQDPGLPIR